ncbi:MAG: dual specificity protein phosphatase family protein [Bdellovibrionales bacterium]
MKLSIFLAVTFFTPTLFANNLQLIESTDNGFAFYRSGQPNEKDMKEFCRLGITEIMVLSGNAQDHEVKHQAACPTLKVIYNEKQDEDIPVTGQFLDEFDSWIQDAKAHGKKVAIRCNCGCHRTGRLAAYYQMKYQNITAVDAWILLDKHGKFMVFFKNLKPQTYALQDYIKGRPCSVEEKWCVR